MKDRVRKPSVGPHSLKQLVGPVRAKPISSDLDVTLLPLAIQQYELIWNKHPVHGSSSVG